MKECISSAFSNPATKSIKRNSITNYCDFALKAIFDSKEDIQKAGYQCAQKNFG
tara:strand:+ start:228 stop:389 length:162 start_codon:yes stop_codon:yes gene_type:complete